MYIYMYIYTYIQSNPIAQYFSPKCINTSLHH